MNKKDTAPREFRGPTKRTQKGLTIIYTGDGKGKTTAAFGAVFRSLGRGYRVAVVQFMKGKRTSGEVKALEKFGNQVDYFSVGEGFTWETKDVNKDIALAKQGWTKCLELLKAKTHHVFLFDELLYVLSYKFLKTADIIEGLKEKDPKSHLILTGRGAPPALLDLADLATEMKELKHPYTQGITAQAGIDY